MKHLERCLDKSRRRRADGQALLGQRRCGGGSCEKAMAVLALLLLPTRHGARGYNLKIDPETQRFLCAGMPILHGEFNRL